MEKTQAVTALGALAQDTRLDIFRLLVEAGPAGLRAGEIGRRLGVPPATLSFHFNQMVHAGLIRRRRESRALLYSASFGTMNALVGYLTDNCCRGRPEDCAPVRPSATHREASRHETPARARRRHRSG